MEIFSGTEFWRHVKNHPGQVSATTYSCDSNGRGAALPRHIARLAHAKRVGRTGPDGLLLLKGRPCLPRPLDRRKRPLQPGRRAKRVPEPLNEDYP